MRKKTLTSLRKIISPIVFTSRIKENDMSSKVPCDAEFSDSVYEATPYGLWSSNLRGNERKK